NKLADDLTEYWRAEGKQQLAFGPCRKLLNLLFRNTVRWSEISSTNRGHLIRLLHVPLDEYSLVAIRAIAGSGELGQSIKIPTKPSMGFIQSLDQYVQIQGVMRQIASFAGMVPISLDLVAWNTAHGQF